MRGLQIAIPMAQLGQRREGIAGPLDNLAIARTPGTIGRVRPRGVVSILRDRQFEKTDLEQLQITGGETGDPHFPPGERAPKPQ